MTHLEENAQLSQELEEARDTIERLIEEKAGITRQRDELARQLEISLTQHANLVKLSKESLKHLRI